MTTTSGFQVKPDFYITKELCIESSKKKIQTNPRYKNFNQTHFTVGDEEQFIEYKYEINGTEENINEDITDNLFYHLEQFNLWRMVLSQFGFSTVNLPNLSHMYSIKEKRTKRKLKKRRKWLWKMEI
jgi:hypothetical protein